MSSDIVKYSKQPVFKPPKKKQTVSAAIRRTRQVAFLEAFAQCGVVTLACRAAGINLTTEWKWRNDAKDTWYDEQFKAALQMYRDGLSAEVHSRAVEGTSSPIIGKIKQQIGADADGNPIFGIVDGHLKDDAGRPMYRTTKSDLLLMFHAKRHIPEYRDNYEAKDGNPRIIADDDSPMTRITIRLDSMRERQKLQNTQREQRALPPSSEASDIIDAVELENTEGESETDASAT